MSPIILVKGKASERSLVVNERIVPATKLGARYGFMAFRNESTRSVPDYDGLTESGIYHFSGNVQLDESEQSCTGWLASKITTTQDQNERILDYYLPKDGSARAVWIPLAIYERPQSPGKTTNLKLDCLFPKPAGGGALRLKLFDGPEVTILAAD